MTKPIRLIQTLLNSHRKELFNGVIGIVIVIVLTPDQID